MLRHQLDHMQMICLSLQTDNYTNTSSINFYRPDALPTNSVKLNMDYTQTLQMHVFNELD